MPKAVLRSRAFERQKCLSLISGLNERRCHISAQQQVSREPNCAATWGEETQLGPDVVHYITRMLRQPRSSHFPSTVFPGSITGNLACQRSLFGFPRESANDSGRHGKGTATEMRWSQSMGPEATYAPPGQCGWRYSCAPLRQLLYSPADRLDQINEVLNGFTFTVPTVISSGFSIDAPCSRLQSQRRRQELGLQEMLASLCPAWVADRFTHPSDNETLASDRRKGATKFRSLVPLTPLSWLIPVQLHKIAAAFRIQFPDPRLIQYDCALKHSIHPYLGKLQRLDLLLQELKTGNHRVLIFTQMARMLDILEQFLAYHGHRYVRLDGTTKVEQRQVLMERFNQDSQIFVFILSTRSGGLGVNLTGADTVIFYDSDWNPTMDAQAQDRCHRIGQTRDVHIYRLISEKTVEENILRKANQKRFLSDVAIEGGRFTTAFFKQNTISDLFAEPTGLQDLASKDTGASKEVESTSDCTVDPASATQSTETDLAALLEVCEDENDRMATKQAMEEAKADLAEFDETIPFDGATACELEDTVDPLVAINKRLQLAPDTNQVEVVTDNNEMPTERSAQSAIERQLSEFDAALRPIERFGIRTVEDERGGSLAEQLELADAHLAESEQNWRLDKLKALHEADEGRAEVEEDDILYCYGQYDPTTQLVELARLDRIIAAEEEEQQQQRLQQELMQQQQQRKRQQQARIDRHAEYQLETTDTKSSRVALPPDNTSDSEPVSVVSEGSFKLGSVKRSRYHVGSDQENEDYSDTVTRGIPLPIGEDQPPHSFDQSVEQPSLYQNMHSWRDNKDIYKSSNHFTSTSMKNSGKRPHTEIARLSNPKLRRMDGSRGARAGTRGSVGQQRSWELSSRQAVDPNTSSVAVNSRLSNIDRPSYTNYSSDKGAVGPPTDGHLSNTSFGSANTSVSPVKQATFDLPVSSGRHPGHLNRWSSIPPSGGTPSYAATSGTQINPHRITVAQPQRSQTFTNTQTIGISSNFAPNESASFTNTTTLSPRLLPCSNILQRPPVRAQRPPAPCIPLQSVRNGTHFNLEAGQLLSTSGQPVFVITREMKTSTGEVYHQRFTHPVVPPHQFSRVVHRLVRPPRVSSSIPSVPFSPPTLHHNGWLAPTIPTIRPATSAISIPVTATVLPIQTSQSTLQSLPVTRLDQQQQLLQHFTDKAVTTTCQQQLLPSPSFSTAICPPSTVHSPSSVSVTPGTPTVVSPATVDSPTSMYATHLPTVSMPILRMLNCASPIVRLAPIEMPVTTGSGVFPTTPVTSNSVRQPVVLAGSQMVTTTSPTANKPQVIRLRRILPANNQPRS